MNWTIKTLGAKVEEMEARLKHVEDTNLDLAEIRTLLAKVKKYIKIWGPIILTALVSNGILSGDWANVARQILHATGAQ